MQLSINCFFCTCIHISTTDSSAVERRTVEVYIDILRSLVRIRLGGVFFYFFPLFSILQEISEVHETSAQEGDTAVRAHFYFTTK